MAHKGLRHSPYNYTLNNLTNLIDPDGRMAIDPNLNKADKEALKQIIKATRSHISGLGKNNRELKALMELGGFKNKKELQDFLKINGKGPTLTVGVLTSGTGGGLDDGQGGPGALGKTDPTSNFVGAVKEYITEADMKEILSRARTFKNEVNMMITKSQLLPAAIILIFLSVWILLSGCKSEAKPVVMLDNECLPVISKFFEMVQAGDYNVALNNLLKSNPDINLNDSVTIDLQIKFKNINELSGKYLEYSIVKKRGIEDDLAIYSCLVKYQKKFYRYVFVFYKAEANAKLYRFSFDDVVDIELEESLKLYLQ